MGVTVVLQLASQACHSYIISIEIGTHLITNQRKDKHLGRLHAVWPQQGLNPDQWTEVSSTTNYTIKAHFGRSL